MIKIFQTDQHPSTVNIFYMDLKFIKKYTLLDQNNGAKVGKSMTLGFKSLLYIICI